MAVSADLCGYVEHSVEHRRAISSVWCREYELNGQTWFVKGQFVTDCPIRLHVIRNFVFAAIQQDGRRPGRTKIRGPAGPSS